MKIKIGENILKLTPANEGITTATITDNGTTKEINLPNGGQAAAGEIIQTTINVTAQTTAISVTFPSQRTEVDVEVTHSGEGTVDIISPNE